MAHVWWHATVRLSRIPTRHRQFLTPVQDPDMLHAKPCTVNPYAVAAFRQCQQFLTPVQAPKTSHSKSLHMYRLPTIPIIAYAKAAWRQLQHFLMRVQAPNTSHPNPYACAGSRIFKKFLTPGQASENSHANPYACTGSQCCTYTSLCLYRFLTLHMHILMLIQVPNISDHSLRLGSLLEIAKIPYMTKINSV
ncbi:hypothetical protein O181_064719 [Austropuccinia psidii MF-1]|uniref:Uncharacterized protein n=1 Tax=Austropuccinia psidii MF-1 TaxID=1389203 RepID=A0A9Q3EQ18_9BASI|nr:hypothetical protein [Austropuccinia psidii MF-1]